MFLQIFKWLSLRKLDQEIQEVMSIPIALKFLYLERKISRLCGAGVSAVTGREKGTLPSDFVRFYSL